LAGAGVVEVEVESVAAGVVEVVAGAVVAAGCSTGTGLQIRASIAD